VKISLQLKGPLKKYGPGEELFELDLKRSVCTVRELTEQFGIPASSVSFITVNGSKEDPERLIEGGDLVVLYPRVAGG
jgi:molybdopterin converting factor small subunit